MVKRWRKISARAVAVVGGVVLIGMTGVPTIAAAAAPGSTADKHCLTLTGVTEQTLTFNYVGSPPAPTPIREVGDTLTYWDDIYAPDGTVIGHTVGMVAAVRKTADNRLITQYHETVTVPDGNIMTTGYMDREAMLHGGVVHLSAIGVSGKYAGKKGFRDWWIIPPIPDPPTSANRVGVRIVMC